MRKIFDKVLLVFFILGLIMNIFLAPHHYLDGNNLQVVLSFHNMILSALMIMFLIDEIKGKVRIQHGD